MVPDWVCEVLSPGTLRTDRMKKMPIFAREKVGHVWLVDPREAPIPPAFLWGKDAPPAAATEGP